MTEPQPDESKLERVIRKIKRCMALSQSANEHEAATAVRQAQALMREHRLTEMDVRLSDVGEVESSVSSATRRPYWDRQLAAMVATTFGCSTLRHTYWCKIKRRRVERATFVGVMPAQHIALYAYETLLAKVKLAREGYAASVRAGRVRSAYTAKTAADHFAIAWVEQMRSKLQALVPQGETDLELAHQQTGQYLVAVETQDQAMIDQYLADKQIGKGRAASAIELDLDAQIAGMLAGAKVKLHAGLATGGDEQFALTST